MAEIVATAYAVEASEADNSDAAEMKAGAAAALENMYDILRRFPLNLLVAHWRMWAETLEAIREYHNPAVVQLVTDDAGRTAIWGVAVVEVKHTDPGWPVALVVTGRR